MRDGLATMLPMGNIKNQYRRVKFCVHFFRVHKKARLGRAGGLGCSVFGEIPDTKNLKVKNPSPIVGRIFSRSGSGWMIRSWLGIEKRGSGYDYAIERGTKRDFYDLFGPVFVKRL